MEDGKEGVALKAKKKVSSWLGGNQRGRERTIKKGLDSNDFIRLRGKLHHLQKHVDIILPGLGL